MEYMDIASKKNRSLHKLLKPLKFLTVGFTMAGSVSAFAAAQPTCSADIVNQWQGGSQVSITISNPDSVPMDDWHVEITYNNGEIANSWSSQREGSNPAHFTAPEWNPNIPANGSHNLGFVATYSGGLQQPTIAACFQGSDAIEDEDSDGVEDNADICPETPADQSVDANGCAETQLDADDDGISNAVDNCPNTPISEVANSEGCSPSQLDADNDGVNDAIDECSNTPANADVDSVGCPIDSDGDGIFDGIDQCVNTPLGASVDANGCPSDADGDGVVDGVDQCSNTPNGATVDASGCPSDSDSDGVLDGLDSCPSTPAGEPVGADGCPLDSDNDGVTDGVDECSNTPEGATVNAVGCPSDSDSDGIFDGIDQCASTPVGAVVEANGCPIDTDNDGVFDGLDQCANTPAGASVASDGCPADSDSDGVFDGIDQCANTAPGTTVDNTGCAADSDGDGVIDDDDSCPNTPSGLDVDENGCAFDSDGDGIDDALDICPNTPAGTMVDAVGCALLSSIRVEAEDYVFAVDSDSNNQGNPTNCAYNGMGVDVSNTSDTGGGCSVGWIASGERLEYSVNLSAGEYILSTRVGSALDQGAYELFLDDVLIASDSVASTGSWSAYATHDLGEVTVAGGTQTLRLEITGSFFNINWINFEFIPPLDSDGDGKADEIDVCPNTPAGEVANAVGCSPSQLDDDNDTVFNNVDICPNTPAGEVANAVGCSPSQLDDDNDTVFNNADTCPNTPAGEVANAVGCSASQLDDDNDTVFNNADTCPNTPAGEVANAVGCSPSQLDDDSDTVFNNADICPNTPAGEVANAVGCSASQLDDDSDTVFNNADICPNTPAGEVSNAVGCSPSQLDDDNDTVFNNVDTCPNTPAGEVANVVGCSASQLDDDNDTVFNNVDTCPNTPAGEVANVVGCSASQLDDDNDTVFNNVDTCPNTPAGEVANAVGCSASQLDDDNDTVFNNADTCPNTPAGEVANAIGCSPSQLDDDADGVFNNVDLCPDTAPGVDVDDAGCEIVSSNDADDDGVNDDLDLCENTTPNSGVTIYGCTTFGDEDGDGIPNDLDYCPFSIGLMELRGCKSDFGDFDRDGVSDDLDECAFSIAMDAVFPFDEQVRLPFELAVEANGCSITEQDRDFDGDGHADHLDRCSVVSGASVADSNGCSLDQIQDEDSDGIINGLDMCPTRFGTLDQNGCDNDLSLDIDSDGIRNIDDSCPLGTIPTAGDVGPNGCSHNFGTEDADQDGVFNRDDECQGTPLGHKVDGLGCTLTQHVNQGDDDGDGVNNQWDLCLGTPSGTPALITAFGCLAVDEPEDQDSDGIPNQIDTCPADSGLLIHGGCPTVFTSGSLNNGPAPLPAELGDFDLDGVLDVNDSCPSSHVPIDGEFTFATDLDGCMHSDLLDDDSDGILNWADRCPRTGSTDFLDAEGCNDFERLDSDGDSLINGEDLCPFVFGAWKLNGCSVDQGDSDSDFVPNEIDQCPRTISSLITAVGPDGCVDNIGLRDGDGDGVSNDIDQCQDTDFGALVEDVDNERGCSFAQLNASLFLDEDGDGVRDPQDSCFGTITGTPVDDNGCPDANGDHDGDNVPNNTDECSNTLSGVAVDFNGCQVKLLPELSGPISLLHIDPEIFDVSQEHEIDLSSLLMIPEDIPSLNSQTIEVVSVDPTVADLFIEDPSGQLFILVNPDFRRVPKHFAARLVLESDGVEFVSNWTEIVIRPRGGSGGDITPAPLESLIINDSTILEGSGILLSDVFNTFAGIDGVSGVRLFQQLWDSQRSTSVFGTQFFCTGEMNGFPIICDRLETEVALMGDFEASQELDRYSLTAVVNRMDTRSPNWGDCGEHRLVFALQRGLGRNFLIFESRIANPTPGDIEGCRPFINFWNTLATTPDTVKGQLIKDFFFDGNLTGVVGMDASHFFTGAGQIRSNQFVGGAWMLREHKLEEVCDGPVCEIQAKTVTVKQNPFAELVAQNSPLEQAPDFKDNFIESMDSLVGEGFGSLSINTEDRFNHGQSHSQQPRSDENDYRLFFSPASDFSDRMDNALIGVNNADGSPLRSDQVLARATGLTCGGCHQPSSFGITESDSIGSLSLPDGRIINSWPRTLGFVHIDESGRLSPALTDVFLPIRQFDFGGILNELP